MTQLDELVNVVLGTFTDVAKMVRSLLSSRTTWVMALGFIAVYASSGKVEAFQQLLAYLGLGSVWVIKMAAQNITGLIKGNGLPAPKPEPKPTPVVEPSKPLPPVVPEKPFDVKTFHERVLSDTGITYDKVNPATVLYKAQSKGEETTCYGIQQAKDYWDYLVTLAYDAEAYVREQTGIDKPGPCKVRSPEHVAAQLEVSKTIRCRDFVYALAQTSIDWKRALGPNDTLYHVGVLAEELLQYNR